MRFPLNSDGGQGNGRERQAYIYTVTEAEYVEKFRQTDSGQAGSRLHLMRLDEKVRHCKVDIFEQFAHGTIAVPVTGERNRIGQGRYIRFYMDEEKLILIGDTSWVDMILDDILDEDGFQVTTTAQALFAFLDVLIAGEGEHIDDWEEDLNEWESKMLKDDGAIPDGFEQYMQQTRRSLLTAYRYYDQMGDMAQTLAESPCEMIDKRSRRLYKFLSDRLDRFSADALNLQEYSSQIYDMYQSRINMKQNRVMQFLTVITTIFMPLTLITGWYGMNFTSMPEIQWEYGYLAVIGLSVALLIIEYVIFKRKKWM